MKFCVGIEGIGMSKSVAVLSDAEGHIKGHAYGKSLRFLEQTEMLRTTLFELLRDVTKEAGLAIRHLKETSLCIGLSEAITPYDRLHALPEMFQRCDLDFARETIFTADGDIVFASHTNAELGCAVVCNAGLTISVVDEKETFRFGGWGPRLGEHGSGRAIGLAAVHHVCNEWTGGEAPSLLWQEIDRWLETPVNGAERMKMVSQKWKLAKSEMSRKGQDIRGAMFFFVKHQLSPVEWDFTVSNLVLPVMRAADQKDPAANRVLGLTAETIAKQFHTITHHRWDRISAAPVVFYGGVLTHHHLFRQNVVNLIEKSLNSRLHAVFPGDPGTMRPVFGALLFALGTPTPTGHRLPAPLVCDRVAASAEDLNAKGECLND